MKNESTLIFKPLSLALVFMLALPAMAQQTTEQLPDHPGRFAPPPSVTCDGRYLDSFNGPVTSYERGDGSITITVQTQSGAFETVKIDYVDTDSKAPYFLYQGQPFTDDDWARIEVEPGVLMEGMGVTAWVCKDGETGTILDWQPL